MGSNKFFYLAVAVVALSVVVASGQIIIVHGSFARCAAWYQPGGDFYDQIARRAQRHGQKVTCFSWRGLPLHHTIKKAGKELAHYILALTDTAPLVVIGHSHGGNVIFYASQFLFDHYEQTKEAVFDMQSHLLLEECRPQGLFDVTFTSRQPSLIPCIDIVHCLGTPIHTDQFLPNMHVIKSVYHYYSEGDLVQSVFGRYDRMLPAQEGCANLKIVFHKKSQSLHHPSHSELHDICIADWLLSCTQFAVLGKTSTVIIHEPASPVIVYESVLSPSCSYSG